MGVTSLAKGLDRHPLIASGLIETHKRAYPRYWQWREDTARSALAGVGAEHGLRCVRSIFGWPLYLSTSPNIRTLYNFPMQSGGAEMLRLAAWRLYEAGIDMCMLIHDGILFQLRDDEQLEHAKQIMRTAGSV